MAFLFKFSVIFCAGLLYSASYSAPVENRDVKEAKPTLAALCADFFRQVSSRKLFCIICRGPHPSCFNKTSSTSTTSTTTSSTTTTSTTTPSTTTTITSTTTSTATREPTTASTAATAVSSTASTRTAEEEAAEEE